jgi:hypothetical protein
MDTARTGAAPEQFAPAPLQQPVITGFARPPQMRPRLAAERKELTRFIQSQATNTARHTAAMRPFLRSEFGEGPAAPSEAHIKAANHMILSLRQNLENLSGHLSEAANMNGATGSLERLLNTKEQAGATVKFIEKVWNFFYELFGQRQTRCAKWLLAADRIALDCYGVIYTGLGRPRSIPTPPPFSYMKTEYTPSTFRRGVRLSRLNSLENPFPIVQLPYHRLVNPWTLGAIHHEVAHNIQSDLGLWQIVPKHILSRLTRSGIDPVTARTWARWHKEIWADLCGALLGGPAVVTSLLDVVGGSRPSTLGFSPSAVHPTPYLRTLISLELLRRMGFAEEAHIINRMWRRLYPNPHRSRIPRDMLTNFQNAAPLVVDTICYQPYEQLGGKNLAQVAGFKPGHQQMIQEAAGRLSTGDDPGILPARYLVGATRWAFDNRLAPPGRIVRNFYQALAER